MPEITSEKIKTIKTITANGTELNYLEAGDGEPLVFVHGSLGDLNTFGQQFTPFSERYHIIAYSRRFHPPNKSGKNYNVYSMDQHVEDLASFINNLSLGKVHLVASSYGAYISLILTIKYPSIVKTLTLGEPPMLPLLLHLPEGALILNSFITNVLKPCREAFQIGNKEEGIRKFIDGIKTQGAFDQIPLDGKMELMRFADVMSLEMLTDPEIYFSNVDDTQLKEINAPVLLVNGDKSPVFFHMINGFLADKLVYFQKTTISNASHSMYRDNPAEFNYKVLAFLSKQ
jgi:non-heme chloroperoxidase